MSRKRRGSKEVVINLDACCAAVNASSACRSCLKGGEQERLPPAAVGRDNCCFESTPVNAGWLRAVTPSGAPNTIDANETG